MSARAIFHHIHLPGITPFTHAQNLQQTLVSEFLSYKASLSTPSPLPAPTPTILTFTPTPVYTTGRREHEAPSPSQTALLKAPLYPLSTHRKSARGVSPQHAEIMPTLRGGQTTFHGPGQLVIYPILDLRTPWPKFPKGISVRCYVHLLESTTIATLKHYELPSTRTENPGVWEPSGEKKIAALGVHLRRSVSSYGVGLNVDTDLRWFERIVACGLEGKGVTSMLALKGEKREIEDVAGTWIEMFGKGLWGQEGEIKVRRDRRSEKELGNIGAELEEYTFHRASDLDEELE